ncbi:PRA1 family protein F2 [Amborella trichopoda]|uniref:PRA1 family protein n=1 Tax=Amborella trichopoda TaxID=13333 RepID=U5D284_AMBTC|nr:PRA1 family protein F2 [Amborella trichopoda]ERN16360.1 hypothetical protein AMTR_s00052p00041770 [Amborella trichopoda]|eukprot:XP_006854893.1 PRA1 family protein F2 [Amborella trichopoda]
MANYGTIPVSSSPSPALDLFSKAKEKGISIYAKRRPWRELTHLDSFSFPPSFREAVARVRANTDYFRVNYALIVLVVVFLSLLWHPVSLIVFLVMMAIWLFLYFLRDDPLIFFGRTLGDRLVLLLLSVVTLVALLLTHATKNILVSLTIGIVLVLVHSAIRSIENHYEDDKESGLLPAESSGST